MLTEELKSHFLNMYLVALSDNEFDEAEMRAIIKIGEDKGISKEEFHKIIIDPTVVPFKIPEDTIKKIEYLFDFAKIIWADGKVDKNERRTLQEFCCKFGFEKEVADELTEWLLEIAKDDISHIDLKVKIDELINS